MSTAAEELLIDNPSYRNIVDTFPKPTINDILDLWQLCQFPDHVGMPPTFRDVLIHGFKVMKRHPKATSFSRSMDFIIHPKTVSKGTITARETPNTDCKSCDVGCMTNPITTGTPLRTSIPQGGARKKDTYLWIGRDTIDGLSGSLISSGRIEPLLITSSKISTEEMQWRNFASPLSQVSHGTTCHASECVSEAIIPLIRPRLMKARTMTTRQHPHAIAWNAVPAIVRTDGCPPYQAFTPTPGQCQWAILDPPAAFAITPTTIEVAPVNTEPLVNTETDDVATNTVVPMRPHRRGDNDGGKRSNARSALPDQNQSYVKEAMRPICTAVRGVKNFVLGTHRNYRLAAITGLPPPTAGVPHIVEPGDHNVKPQHAGPSMDTLLELRTNPLNVDKPLKTPAPVVVGHRKLTCLEKSGARRNVVVDDELLGHLRLEALYQPRNIMLLQRLTTSAKRYIKGFDMSAYTTNQIHAMLSTTIMAAFDLPLEEQSAMQYLVNTSSNKIMHTSANLVQRGIVGKVGTFFSKQLVLPE